MAQNETQLHIRSTDLDKRIVESIDNGIIIIDTSLKIHHYNKWMEIQTHRKEDDVILLKITDLFPSIKEKVLTRKVKTALRMNNATYYTASTSKYLIPIKIDQLQNSHYDYMQQDVSIVPYDAKLEQVAIIITDQTRMSNANALLEENIQEVKKLNQELLKEKELTKNQHEQLIASSRNAAMGEMISMIAHQWRQPLSVINTSIATMKVKQELEILDDTTLENSFNQIEKTVIFLSETINDFRDYFKPNKLKTDVKISELFEKSIYFIKAEMANMNIEFIKEIDEDIHLETYKNELLQTIINIIKNSIDAFKETRTPNKTIQVSVQNKNNDIIMFIQDNAGGIKEEILKKVFEPYFSTKSKNGTGLGLYMCHSIITEHLHGKISIDSKNANTRITIILPSQTKEKE